MQVMRKFSEQYAKGSGTYFCVDKSVTAVVICGLAEHKVGGADLVVSRANEAGMRTHARPGEAAGRRLVAGDGSGSPLQDTLGAPLCPCRHYDDKEAEAKQGFWNCPCVPMRERKECHCMLFLTEDNDFAGKEQAISMEEIVEGTKGM